MDALSLLEVQQWMKFDPPEDKAINVLLRAKITGKDESVHFIPEVQSCKWEPWDLKVWLDSRWIKTAYPEWWFFSPLDLKRRSGNRLNRATEAGFWKVTGKDKIIESHLGRIGKKKYLVFYSGRGKGTKTNWAIHEYHTTLKDLDGTHPGQNAFVLCRLSYENEKSIKDTNINDAGLAVSSPTKSKLFHEESESEQLLAPVFPASDAEATTTPENCDEKISSATTAVKCDDKHISAHAAGNQLGELTTIHEDKEIEQWIIELQQIEGDDVLMPSTSPPNNPTVSSATTTKSFEEGLSLSDLPSKPSDPVTYNRTVVSNKDNGSCTGSGAKMANKPLELCDQNSYNAYTAKNEVLEATASELVESLYMRDLPKPPDCNLHMPFGRPSPVTDDSNNSHCGMDFQFVTYGLDPYDNEFRDLTTEYLNESFPNTFGS